MTPSRDAPAIGDDDLMHRGHQEFRRLGYALLVDHAQRRQLLPGLAQPGTVEDVVQRFQLASPPHEVALLLDALVAAGALTRTSGTTPRYRRAEGRLLGLEDIDLELVAVALGTDAARHFAGQDTWHGPLDRLQVAAEPDAAGEGPLGMPVSAWDELFGDPFYRWGRLRAVRAVARPGDRVLDVGCGTGRGLLEMADIVGPDGAVHGVDIDERFLELARARTTHLPNVRVVTGDADAGDLGTSWQFDGAVVMGVYHQLRHPRAALGSIATALRRGGRLCVAHVFSDLDTPDAPLMRLQLGLARPPVDPVPVARMRDEIRRAGFRIETEWALGCFASVVARRVR